MAVRRKQTTHSARRRPPGTASSKPSARATPMKRSKSSVDFEIVRQIAHEFPGVEDSTSYGTPALKVKGALLLRLREDGETLALRTTFLERDLLLRADPETYFVTDHYLNYPAILVRMARIAPDELRDRLEHTWRHIAPKRLIAAFDNR
jgi:hypothetical protein